MKKRGRDHEDRIRKSSVNFGHSFLIYPGLHYISTPWFRLINHVAVTHIDRLL